MTAALRMCIALLVISLPAMAVEYPIVALKSPRTANTWDRLPDFSMIFAIKTNTVLVKIDPDGTETTLVTPPAGQSIIDPAPSLDGRFVYYSVVTPGDNSRARIDRIEVATGKVEVIADWGANWLLMGSCPLPGGEFVFTGTFRAGAWRQGDVMSMSRTCIYKRDLNSSRVECIVGGAKHAIHPVLSPNGQIVFSCEEGFGTRDARRWAIWYCNPDGTGWNTSLPAMDHLENGFHYHTVLPSSAHSGGQLYSTRYYNQNNGGFGGIYSCSLHPTNGSPVCAGAPGNFLAFAPKDLRWVTTFEPGSNDISAKKDAAGVYVGKVTHPQAAPGGDVLAVWSPGPVNVLREPRLPSVHGHIVIIKSGATVDHPSKLQIVKAPDETSSYLMPRPLLPVRDIFGNVPPVIASRVIAGQPAIFGTSTLSRAEVKPQNIGANQFKATSNYTFQGSADPAYQDADIDRVRFLALARRGAWTEPALDFVTSNSNQERVYILGEIKVDRSRGVDAEGLADTSFAVRLPPDRSVTYQLLDRQGRAIVTSATRHWFRPGEVRTDCRGCHRHWQPGPVFDGTAAAKDLAIGKVSADFSATKPRIVEFARDVKPILVAHCSGCHVDGGTEGKAVNWSSFESVKSLCDNMKSWNSVLAKRICTDDELARMPKGADPLSEADRETILAWIDTGMTRMQDTKTAAASLASVGPDDVSVVKAVVATPEAPSAPDPEPPVPEPSPSPLSQDEILQSLNSMRYELDALLRAIAERGVQ